MNPPIDIIQNKVTAHYDPLFSGDRLTVKLHLNVRGSIRDYLVSSEEGTLMLGANAGFETVFGNVDKESWQELINVMAGLFNYNVTRLKGSYVPYMCSIVMIVRGLYHFCQDYLFTTPEFRLAVDRLTSMNIVCELSSRFPSGLEHRFFPFDLQGKVGSAMYLKSDGSKHPYMFSVNVARRKAKELRNTTLRHKFVKGLRKLEPISFTASINREELFSNILNAQFNNHVWRKNRGFTINELYDQMDLKKNSLFVTRKGKDV